MWECVWGGLGGKWHRKEEGKIMGKCPVDSLLTELRDTQRCLSETFREKKKKQKHLILPAYSSLLFDFWVFWFPGCFISTEVLRSCMCSGNKRKGPLAPGAHSQSLSIWSVYATDPGMGPVSHHHEKQWSLCVFSPFGDHTSPLAPMPYRTPVRLWNKRGSIGVVASSPLFLRAANWDPGNTGQLLFV